MSQSRLLEAFRENERDLLRFLVARLRSVFVAQDIVQDLYLRLSSLDEGVPVRNDRAYLFRMAANLAVDHQRREARHADLLAEAGALLSEPVDHATPEQTLLAREELARLEQALAELPELSRRIFHLNRFEEKSHREIAGIVGISPTMVFKHIRRVLDHLARAREP